MTKEQEAEVQRLITDLGVVSISRVLFKGMDISEMINVIILSGKGYSAKLLNFFKWYCQIMPVFIMLFHIACMITFASHSKEMGIWFKENWVSYAFIYFSVYIHPLVIILASRFFWLCYRWRIPMFIYLFGINAIHIVYGSVFTTNAMVSANVVILVTTLMFYLYGFADKFFSGKGYQSIISRI
nr:hypothetical protein [uncultured Prevotella sp.]